MKPSPFALLFSAALCAAAALSGPTLRAQANFLIHVDTSSLISNSAAPFYLDFQLNDGSGFGNNNNSAILSAFNFHGGAALPAISTFGNATGNLNSTITLNDSSFLNEFFQAFTPGTSLDFRLQLSTNVNLPTPDLFAFSILDHDLFSLATTAVSDALIEITINSRNPIVNTYAGDVAGGGIAIAAPTLIAVPEPASYGLMAVVALSVAIFARRRLS